MKVVYLSQQEFEKMWQDFSQNRQYTSPNLDPILRSIPSKDSKFKTEYDRMFHKFLYPDPPIEIHHYDVDGLTIYKRG